MASVRPAAGSKGRGPLAFARSCSSRPEAFAGQRWFQLSTAQIVLAAFLFLLTYDGAMRKWLISGSEQIVFLLKDVIFTVGVLAVVRGGAWSTARFQLPLVVRATLAAYVAWILVHVFNPYLPSVVLGVWGAKSHLLYAGLILLVPVAAGSLSQLMAAIERVFPWLVIPVCSLALLQVAAPPDHVLNRVIADDLEVTAFFGDAGLVRVFGPFSYISGMASFVSTMAVLGTGLYLAGYRSRSFVLGLAAILLCLPVTGSRSVIAFVALGLAMQFLGGAVAGLAVGRDLARSLVLLVALVGLSLYSQADIWLALQQRVEASRDDEFRVLTAFTNAFGYFEIVGLIGYGTGATNAAAPVFVPGVAAYSWLPFGFEEESGRIVLELGTVGWAVGVAFRLAVLLWCLWLLLRGANRTVRVAAIIALPFLASALHFGTGFAGAAYGAVAFWFFMAVLAMAHNEHVKSVTDRDATLGRAAAYERTAATP